MLEKRQYARLDTAVKVQDFNTSKTGWTKNISLGGCLIEKSHEFDFLSTGSRLTLKFEIPGVSEPVLASGIVRHRGKHGEGFGIQFEAVDKTSAFYLGKFMGSFL